MKYLGLIPALLMAMATVSAVDMIITPQLASMGYNDMKEVEVCVYKADNSPYEGLDLQINTVCQDLNGDEACGPGDGDPSGIFSVTVMDSPTNASGCGTIKLETTDATGGTFAYQVNGYNAEVLVNSEGGIAYIPEFGVLASAVVLSAAGLYIYRRRG